MNKRQRQIAKLRKYPFKKRIQIWNPYLYFAKYIYGGLIQFRKQELHGYAQDAGSPEKWVEILDEMIWTFREIAEDYPGNPRTLASERACREHPEFWDVHFVPADDGMHQMIFDHPELHDAVFTPKLYTEEKAYEKRIEDGIQLFAKYFRDIWD